MAGYDSIGTRAAWLLGPQSVSEPDPLAKSDNGDRVSWRCVKSMKGAIKRAKQKAKRIGGQYRPPCKADHCHVDYRNGKGQAKVAIHYFWRKGGFERCSLEQVGGTSRYWWTSQTEVSRPPGGGRGPVNANRWPW